MHWRGLHLGKPMSHIYLRVRNLDQEAAADNCSVALQGIRDERDPLKVVIIGYCVALHRIMDGDSNTTICTAHYKVMLVYKQHFERFKNSCNSQKGKRGLTGRSGEHSRHKANGGEKP